MPQRPADPLVERGDVDPDVALRDDGPLVRVDVLDGLLEAEDMDLLFSLIQSTIAATVVDLPLPVIPVTRISPKWSLASFSIVARGMFRSSNDGIVSGR